MMTNINLWSVAVYIGLFAAAAIKGRLVFWPLASFLLWLAAAAALLPSLRSPLVLWLSYMPQLYIAPFGLPFLFFHHRQKKKNKGGHQKFAILFAESCTVWTTASFLLLASAWLVFPKGQSPRIIPAVLDMYLLQPFFSLSMQLILMAVFWRVRQMDAVSDPPRRRERLAAGILMLLPAQLIYVFGSLLPPH